jgi:hypothetical protein
VSLYAPVQVARLSEALHKADRMLDDAGRENAQLREATLLRDEAVAAAALSSPRRASPAAGGRLPLDTTPPLSRQHGAVEAELETEGAVPGAGASGEGLRRSVVDLEARAARAEAETEAARVAHAETLQERDRAEAALRRQTAGLNAELQVACEEERELRRLSGGSGAPGVVGVAGLGFAEQQALWARQRAALEAQRGTLESQLTRQQEACRELEAENSLARGEAARELQAVHASLLAEQLQRSQAARQAEEAQAAAAISSAELEACSSQLAQEHRRAAAAEQQAQQAMAALRRDLAAAAAAALDESGARERLEQRAGEQARRAEALVAREQAKRGEVHLLQEAHAELGREVHMQHGVVGRQQQQLEELLEKLQVHIQWTRSGHAVHIQCTCTCTCTCCTCMRCTCTCRARAVHM